jgi:phosphoribosylanthranilate isomerase
MTWVKICGITNLEDALVAVEAGADAVGFVFYEKSPRCVSVETAREIVAKLPESVEKVGVFVKESLNEWASIALRVGLTATQWYPFSEMGSRSNRTRAVGAGIFPKPIKCFTALPAGFFLQDEERIHGLVNDLAHWQDGVVDGAPQPPDSFLLDSGGLENPGGTGKTFDWSKAVPIAQGMRQVGLKLVVAGGLTPENVSEAIEILKPWGVDVASGVEARPGKKDSEKVRAFVRAVREADRRAS